MSIDSAQLISLFKKYGFDYKKVPPDTVFTHLRLKQDSFIMLR
ncbi:Uncharacterised protein [Escherichia coli]|nr:Uncharacterised protein [Escherichia coli]